MKALGGRRMLVLLALTVAVAGSLAFLQITTPVEGRHLARADASYFWPAAVVSALIILAVDVVTVVFAVRRWRKP